MSSWRVFCVTDFRDQVDNLSSNYLYPLRSVIIGWRGTLPEECQKGCYVGWREAAENDPLGFLMQMMHRSERTRRGSRTLIGRSESVPSVTPLAFSLMLCKGKQSPSWGKVSRCLPGSRPETPLPWQGQMVAGALQLSTFNSRSKCCSVPQGVQEISMTSVSQVALGLHHSTPVSSLWVDQNISYSPHLN